MAKKSKNNEIKHKRDRKEVELRDEFQQMIKVFEKESEDLNFDSLPINEGEKTFEKAEKYVSDEIFNEEKWIEQRLKKFDEEQIKVPSGKFKDHLVVYAQYQKHFIEEVRNLCPEVIEELKQFIPQFKSLFNNPTAFKCQEIFYNLRQEITKDYLFFGRSFTNDDSDLRDYSFYWGKYEPLLNQLKQNNLGNLEQTITKAFGETTEEKELIIANFIDLMIGLVVWAKKHNLEKDWIIEYCISFLWQFSYNDITNIKDLVVNLRDIRSMEITPFEFRERGWRAGEETKQEYEDRLKVIFQDKLRKYFDSEYRNLNLPEKTKATRPIDYSRVKWLVRWTVQGWIRKKILDEIYNETGQSSDESLIFKTFKVFREHNLPVRN